MLSLGRADFKLISLWAHSRNLQRTTSCCLPSLPTLLPTTTQTHLIGIPLMWAVTLLITFSFCPFLPQAGSPLPAMLLLGGRMLLKTNPD